MSDETLKDRELRVLDAIVRNYILNATPTGSRYLSRQKEFGLSAASLRNVMSDLEEQGFITQPYTSAGRIPTDKGYRYYVDRIMRFTELPDGAKHQIRNALVTVESSDLHLLLEAASRALSKATNQLGVILSPRLRVGVLSHLTVIPIASIRYMLTVAFDSGFVKTMVIEFETGIPHDRLECACRIINNKYSGKTLQDLCDSDDCMFRDVQDLDLGVIRLLVPSIRKIIEQDGESNVFAEGQTNILLQPEFFNRDVVGAIIEVLEEKNLLMHLFETSQCDNGVVISIGGENTEDQFKSFSVIKTQYKVGSMVGSLGVIGPKRMPYPLLVSAVEYTARVLGELHTTD